MTFEPGDLVQFKRACVINNPHKYGFALDAPKDDVRMSPQKDDIGMVIRFNGNSPHHQRNYQWVILANGRLWVIRERIIRKIENQ